MNDIIYAIITTVFCVECVSCKQHFRQNRSFSSMCSLFRTASLVYDLLAPPRTVILKNRKCTAKYTRGISTLHIKNSEISQNKYKCFAFLSEILFSKSINFIFFNFNMSTMSIHSIQWDSRSVRRGFLSCCIEFV